MFTPEDVQGMLAGIERLNLRLGSFALIIPIFFAVVVIALLVYCYKSPGRRSSSLLLGSLAAIYAYSGWTILSGSGEMGETVALVGAIALWAVAALLILDVIFHWTEVRLPEGGGQKVLSFGLMFSGIFLYPILEMALGFNWPGMVLFGAECPTTIFLVGLLIGSIPRVNKPLFIIASLNALATGLSVALSGATFDYLYAAAGISGIVMIIINFKRIFSKKIENAA